MKQQELVAHEIDVGIGLLSGFYTTKIKNGKS